MLRIFDIALKDLLQLSRDFKTFMFLLLMPIAFTLLFGYAFGAFSSGGSYDPRLPVGFVDEDNSSTSRRLRSLLDASEVIRLKEAGWLGRANLEKQVTDGDLAALVVIPQGYGRIILHGKRAQLILIGDTSTPAGTSIKSDVLAKAVRLESAVRAALAFERTIGDQTPFDYILEQSLEKWQDPPIRVVETTSTLIEVKDNGAESLAHTSPAMMLQFAIAGLLTSAQIVVTERKSLALQRMLTTATARVHILLGHFLAILALVLSQSLTLIAFGQFLLRVQYLRVPSATLLVACAAALCTAALGLLIGVLARNEDQAVMFSIIPMFVLSGLGGAWVPLEVTGETFQMIGHLSPIAWAMDGFKNISIRGLGMESVLLPSAVLLGYAIVFFVLAIWRFRTE